MTAGTGYRYLLQSVAVGDGDRRATTSMTRYYSEPGTPPGRWIGAGLAGLDDGRGLIARSPVTEEQLFRLLGMALDPVSGKALGAAPKAAAPDLRARVHARLTALPQGLTPPDRAQRIEQIKTEEHDRPTARSSKAVTAFDLTMSVPKSVSAVWAVADAHTQELIMQAHHAAVADALAWAERNVFATRLGRGGATQVGVRGVVAASFDHHDSRANDPHLHTHVVVANRVQSSVDDKWRTLDSRAIFRATVALSELHQGLLMDRVTELLGVGWDGRARRHSPVLQWEIAGVPDELRQEFSRRSADIDAAKDQLVTAYTAEHGRAPSAATVLKLRQQATLETRPDKHLHSLAKLTQQWRDRARQHVDGDPTQWVRGLPRPQRAAIQSSDLQAEQVQHLAEQTLAAVASKRATFSRWNVFAEAQRQLHGAYLASADARIEVGNRVTDSALGLAMLLTAPDAGEIGQEVPASPQLQTSAARYTTRHLFDAEDRLLDAARDVSGPAAPLAHHGTHVGRLSGEQFAAVARVAGSGRTLDVLVGAAGTGKTATLGELAAAWKSRYGPGSVIGLAPSASAADVLARELALPTENTAMWLTQKDLEPKRRTRLAQLEDAITQLPARSARAMRVDAVARKLRHDIDRWQLKANQLVIIDEASLAGTLTLDRIVDGARAANAKVLLVGDWAQLAAVDAGGAFGMLARDRSDAAELLDVHRFAQAWEKDASLGLRVGDHHAVQTYAALGRVHDGDRSTMLDAAYAGWLADQRTGRRSLLLAADSATVTDLNNRARSDLVRAGHVAADGVGLADGPTAGIGDRVVTRRNDRTNPAEGGWIKNGDEWLVVGAPGVGLLDVRRVDGSGTATLSADYVREHVDLAYASTAHRAEGRTVDTAHAVVTGPGMTRESLYVVMTRGRAANHAYVATDYVPDADTAHGPSDRWAAHNLLESVLDNVGAEMSAHETLATVDADAKRPIPTADQSRPQN